MGMQDNPLVGDYTKGVSKNTAQYFRNLENRCKQEKFKVSRLGSDLGNPLFAMISGPVDPLKMAKNGRIVDKPGDNFAGHKEKVTDNIAKKGWQKVSLDALKDAFNARKTV